MVNTWAQTRSKTDKKRQSCEFYHDCIGLWVETKNIPTSSWYSRFCLSLRPIYWEKKTNAQDTDKILTTLRMTNQHDVILTHLLLPAVGLFQFSLNAISHQSLNCCDGFVGWRRCEASTEHQVICIICIKRQQCWPIISVRRQENKSWLTFTEGLILVLA